MCKRNKERKQTIQMTRRPREIKKRVFLALFMGMHKKELTNNVQTKVDLKARPNDRKMSTQHIATLLGATCCARLATLLRNVGCCWFKFEDGQICGNNTQYVATRRNRAAKRKQHVAPNNVAICYVDMLRSLAGA